MCHWHAFHSGLLQIQTDANMIATFEAKPRVYEGHPFIVEAGVSIGGDDSVSTGVTVHRFANRIPMLFEGLLNDYHS